MRIELINKSFVIKISHPTLIRLQILPIRLPNPKPNPVHTILFPEHLHNAMQNVSRKIRLSIIHYIIKFVNLIRFTFPTMLIPQPIRKSVVTPLFMFQDLHQPPLLAILKVPLLPNQPNLPLKPNFLFIFKSLQFIELSNRFLVS